MKGLVTRIMHTKYQCSIINTFEDMSHIKVFVTDRQTNEWDLMSPTLAKGGDNNIFVVINWPKWWNCVANFEFTKSHPLRRLKGEILLPWSPCMTTGQLNRPKKPRMCLWNTNAPSSKKNPKLAIFSIKVTVEVTRSLTLVSFERVSLVEYTCQIWSLLRIKSNGQVFCHRVTERFTNRQDKS